MATLREHDAVVSRKNMFHVDPRKLVMEPGYNVRDLTTSEAKVKLNDLMLSIIENGVRTPVTVRLRGDVMTVVAGHRRLTASMMAIAAGHALVSIPALAEDAATNDEARTLDLILSNSGEPLAPLEKAEVLRRLIGFGNTEAMIAQKLGWSTATVESYKSLIGANADVKAMIRAGDVSASAAIAAVKAHGEGAAGKLRATAAAAPLKATGAHKRVSARVTKKASGDESALSKKEIRSLVLGLRYIYNNYEGSAAERAKTALESAGVSLSA